MNEKQQQRLIQKYARKEDPSKMKGRGGGPRGMMKTGKPKNSKKTIGRLFSYIAGDKWKLVIVFFMVIINTVGGLAGSYLLRPVVNMLTSPGGSVEKLLGYIGIMAAVYAAVVISQYLQARIMIEVSQKALEKLRNDLFRKVQKLPVRFYDTNNHGDVMSRFTNDVDAIGEMLNNTIVNLISGTITLVGTLSLMIYTNWILTLVTFALIPVMVFAGQAVAKVSSKYYKAQQTSLGTLNGYVEETVTGQKVVKVFNHEATAVDEFNFLNEDLASRQVKAQFFGGIMGPVMGNISQASYALTSMVGGVLCVLQGFDVGGLTVFVNYSRQFSRPINELSMQMNTIFSALAGAERVFDVMDQQEEEPDKDGALTPPIKGFVRLEDVTFGYNPDKVILKNVSLYAKPGQKIAFVGSTGAGKTTVTNLINRFYDIDSGKITIDDVDIKDIKRDYLRQNVAMVLQDTHLFTGTIKDNIRYGRMDATDEEIIEAAKTASAHSFIMRLEHGYDTVIEGDGANLSQGQRQLLNIARAAISKAPILILDEATSSVDTRTEKHIEHGMDRLMATRTTLVIAHRLSTVRDANAIMVLEHGKIIERGDHDQLLEQKGRYYELYTGKSELS